MSMHDHDRILDFIDGTLSNEERQAFMRQLQHDPDLHAALRDEIRFEQALIDDAFAVVPPSAARDAVLHYVQHAAVSHTIDGSAWVAPRWLMLIALLISVSVRTASVAPASYATPSVVTPGTVLSSLPVRGTPAVAAQRRAHTDSVADTPDPSPIAISAAPRVQEERIAVVEHNSMAVYGHDERPIPTVAMSTQPDHVQALSCSIGPSFLGLRYDVHTTSLGTLFVDAGSIRISREQTVWVGTTPTTSSAPSTVPYLGIGHTARLITIDGSDLCVNGALSVGATRIGPFAAPEISVHAQLIQTLGVDVGYRGMLLYDLAGTRTTSLQTLPYIRLSVSIP